MKKHLLALSASFMGLLQVQTQAQNIPNNSFEDWITVTRNLVTYDDPAGGWTTQNFAAKLGGNLAAEKVADPRLGSYALRLNNFPAKQLSGKDTVWGSSAFIGFKSNGNLPAILKGSIKYSLQQGETAVVQYGVGMPNSNSFLLLGQATFQGSNTAAYETFEVNGTPPFFSEMEDSLYISILTYNPLESVKKEAALGSYVQIDSLFFEGSLPKTPKISLGKIGNGGFEDWVSYGNYHLPDYWNALSAFSQPASLYKSDVPHSGTFALGFGTISNNAAYTLFVPQSGDAALMGYANYELEEDSVVAFIGKYSRQYPGGFAEKPVDTVFFKGSSTGYKHFIVNYKGQLSSSDTVAFVLAYPSKETANSRLSAAPFFYLDDLRSERPEGLEDDFIGFNKVKVYPNPSKEGIFYLNKELPSTELRVSDAAGNELSTVQIQTLGGQTKLDLSHLNKGIYFVTCRGKTLKLVY